MPREGQGVGHPHSKQWYSHKGLEGVTITKTIGITACLGNLTHGQPDRPRTPF